MTFDITLLILALIAMILASVALTLELSSRVTSRLLQHHGDHARVGNLEQQIQMFSRLIEQSLATRLHAPTHARLDQLLHKLSDDTITTDESRTLHRLILERSTELQLTGPEIPDLTFPRMLTLWSLEVRLATVGQSLGGQSLGGQSLGGQSLGGQSLGGQSLGGQSKKKPSDA